MGLVLVAIYHPFQKQTSLATTTTSSSYTESELHAFWDMHGQAVMNDLFNQKFPLPKIQERFTLNQRLILKRYNVVTIEIHLLTGYMPESKNVIAGMWVKDGKPHVDIVVAKLLDVYNEHKRLDAGKADELFGNFLAVSLIHEFDHLAYSERSDRGSREHPLPINELVEDERKIWALTCEYTLRPFIEEYRAPVSSNESLYYHAWIDCGRNVDGPGWKRFIYDGYRQTR